jgi:hypothetical protein
MAKIKKCSTNFEINLFDQVEIDELCGFRYQTRRIW